MSKLDIDLTEHLPCHTIGQSLVVTIPAKLDYFKIEWLQNQILNQLKGKKLSGFILDLSMNKLLDASTMKDLIQLAKMSRLLGINCVLIGLSAPLVCALIDYDIDIDNLLIARTLEAGLALLLTTASGVAAKDKNFKSKCIQPNARQ